MLSCFGPSVAGVSQTGQPCVADLVRLFLFVLQPSFSCKCTGAIHLQSYSTLVRATQLTLMHSSMILLTLAIVKDSTDAKYGSLLVRRCENSAVCISIEYCCKGIVNKIAALKRSRTAVDVCVCVCV